MGKDGFYVQLHMHTSETSGCARATGAEMAAAAREAGYDMIVITDHFMNANIGCPGSLPWKAKVEYLTRVYKNARKVGEKLGLKVLFGWETFNSGPEYLTYGLDEEFLLDNPDIADVGQYEYLDRIRRAGGFVIHAHPFRKASYIPDFVPDPRSVEAFEVFNAGHRDPSFNDQARAMARKFDLIMTAGSDAHVTEAIGRGAMRFPYEISDMDELIAAIRRRDGEIIEKMR
jgi:predicted metal-dependent phosphoesterase TrpH